jgi:hypothetical protein
MYSIKVNTGFEYIILSSENQKTINLNSLEFRLV